MAEASHAELASIGMTLDDLDDGRRADLWPENIPAADAFTALSTQWRMGTAGPIGLDYTSIPPVLRLLGHPRAQWSDTFDCLRILEDEALKVMGERRG